METLTKPDITSFVHCILELVDNSLSAHASAIAIRIHEEKREILIIDNGVGIPQDVLKRIGEYNVEETEGNRQTRDPAESTLRTLTSIRRLSNTLTVASRYRYSTKTFMKIFKIGHAPDLTQTEQRPSYGTTICIYGFHEIPLGRRWNISDVCLPIGIIAVTKLTVSFSIRDERRRKVIMRIAKPHSPIKVLRMLFGKNLSPNHMWLMQYNSGSNIKYYGYIGLADKNAMQRILLNQKFICCSLILKLIKIGFEEILNLSSYQEFKTEKLHNKGIFILLFLTLPKEEFTYVTKNRRRYAIFYDTQKILNSIKNCTFKRLAGKNAVTDGTPYLYRTQLYKKICLKPKMFVFNNHITKHKYFPSVTRNVRKNEIIMIGFKRRKITSKAVTNYPNEPCNKNNNIKVANRYMEKEISTLNSVQCQIDIASTKHTTLRQDLRSIKPSTDIKKFRSSKKDIHKYNDETSKLFETTDVTCLHDNKLTKKMFNDTHKMQTNCASLATENISVKSKRIYNRNNDNTNGTVNIISPLSEWSDWTNCTNNERNSVINLCDTFSKDHLTSRQLFKYNEQFDFLPEKLYNLLQHYRTKLTNVKCFNSPASTIPLEDDQQYEQMEVHPCNLKRKLCEFTLSRDALKFIKVINQINNEFISAWIIYDKMKILLMLDQHAVHERIRYENLLVRYKAQNKDGLLSINLYSPLIMEFSTKMCNLLLCNKTLLKQYGISLGSLKENTLLIRAIPQCLIKNNDYSNNKKILPKIYNLLNEILENRTLTNHADMLPFTVHNAIASEACHGAIKFGDKLTLEQCTSLIKLLKYTKFPNRCAHGRPTMIPVMDLSGLEERCGRIHKKKLNFASLKISLK